MLELLVPQEIQGACPEVRPHLLEHQPNILLVGLPLEVVQQVQGECLCERKPVLHEPPRPVPAAVQT